MDITDIVVEQQPAASPKLGLPPEGHGRRSPCIRRTAPPRNAHADLAATVYAAEITTQGLRLRHPRRRRSDPPDGGLYARQLDTPPPNRLMLYYNGRRGLEPSVHQTRTG